MNCVKMLNINKKSEKVWKIWKIISGSPPNPDYPNRPKQDLNIWCDCPFKRYSFVHLQSHLFRVLYWKPACKCVDVIVQYETCGTGRLTLIPTGEPTSGPHCFRAKYLGIFFM
jgi:hypothetical protein